MSTIVPSDEKIVDRRDYSGDPDYDPKTFVSHKYQDDYDCLKKLEVTRTITGYTQDGDPIVKTKSRELDLYEDVGF